MYVCVSLCLFSEFLVVVLLFRNPIVFPIYTIYLYLLLLLYYILFYSVDWAAHEQQLLTQYTQRCQGRPYHTQSFQTLNGTAPVTFTPRIVVLQSSASAGTSYGVVLHNHSTSNTVRFEVCNELASLPWISINPTQGIMAPGECYALEIQCHAGVAEQL